MSRYLVGLINYYEVEAEDEREALDIAEEIAEDIFLYDEEYAGYDGLTITKIE